MPLLARIVVIDCSLEPLEERNIRTGKAAFFRTKPHLGARPLTVCQNHFEQVVRGADFTAQHHARSHGALLLSWIGSADWPGILWANSPTDVAFREASCTHDKNEFCLRPICRKSVAAPVAQGVLHIRYRLAIGRQQAGCKDVSIHRLDPDVTGVVKGLGNAMLLFVLILCEDQRGQQDNRKNSGQFHRGTSPNTLRCSLNSRHAALSDQCEQSL